MTTPRIAACVSHLRARFGASVNAIVFYGAGLRTPTADALLDFYVLVDDMHGALGSHAAALAGRILPPNVYRIEVPDSTGTIACKVAVMALGQFRRGMEAFEPQLWARFAQPAAIVYARDAAVDAHVAAAFDTARATLLRRTAPLMPLRFTARDIWTRALTETYAAELRPEAAARAPGIVESMGASIDAYTAAVFGPPGADGTYVRPPSSRWRARAAWALRRRWGKLLNLVRLMKAAFTFAGGLDYAAAKIAKHAGVKIVITDADRRRPLRAGLRLFLEARRRGGVR